MVVLVAMVAGTVLRLWSLTTPAVQIDGDQSVTGIMVNNILAGRGNYVFIAGQRYNGALEQWLQAGLYWVLPIPRNSFTLRLVDVVLMMLCCWLVFVVGRLVLRSEWRAAVAAVLFAGGPYWTLWKGDHSDGAYPSLMAVGLVGLYCALRLEAGAAYRARWAAGLGLCAGLIVWLEQSGVFLLLPAALWVAPVLVRSWRPWAAGLPAMVVGASPSLLWSIKHGIFAPIDTGLSTVPTTLSQRLHNVTGPLLREFVGVASDAGGQGWPFWLQHIAVAVLGGAVVIGFVRRRRGIASVLSLRTAERRPIDVMLLSVPVILVIYVVSKSAWDIANPHYLFVCTPIYLWLLAAMIPRRHGWGRPAVAVVLMAGVVGTSVTMLVNRSGTYPGTSDADLKATVAYLTGHGHRNVYADFWTAMPLQYFAGTALDVEPLFAGKGKFPASERRVNDGADFVLVSSPRNDSGRVVDRPPSFAAQLDKFHVKYQEVHIGTVTVFYGLNPRIRPWLVGIGNPPSVH